MKILLAAVNSKYIHTNLAVRYIKTYCSEFDILLKEYSINDCLHDVISNIYSENPALVGFSCYIWNIDMVLKLCSSLKKVLPSLKILLGGPEVSFDSRNLLENNPYVDYIIRGEGEVPSYQLFHYLEHNTGRIDDIKGLVYRNHCNVLENNIGELISDLDGIPFPYGYTMEGIENKILYYESSRGCPYNCSYCLSSTIKGVRFFSLDRVKKDLMWFIDNNIRLVKFVDRTFNCGRNYMAVFKFLVENRKNTRFHFEISGEILDNDCIEYLKTVPQGLFQFEIGVQTTNEKALDLIGRKSDITALFKNISELEKSGSIPVHLDLIAGLPGEGYESFIKSFNDVYSLKPNMLQLGFLKLLKGSRVRQDADEFGILYNEYTPYEVLCTNDLSYEEVCLLKRVEDMVDRYYNSGRFTSIMIYLNSIFGSPFSLFSDISNFYNNSSFAGRTMSNIEQYRLLFDFCIYYSVNMDTAAQCMAFDYLSQGRNPVMPQFLSLKNNIDKQFIWDFCSNQNNIDKYFPYYKDTDTRQIIKSIYGIRLSFDVCKYINTEIMEIHDNMVFFDYSVKNNMDKVYYFCVNV